MSKYKIKFVSNRNTVLLFLISLPLLGLGLFYLFLNSRSLAIVRVVGFIGFIIIFFLRKKFVTGFTEWEIDENKVSIIWVKQFKFTNNEDSIWEWSDIKRIDQHPGSTFYTLKIELVSGKKMIFYHDISTKGDDFNEFIKVLFQTYNKNVSQNT